MILVVKVAMSSRTAAATCRRLLELQPAGAATCRRLLELQCAGAATCRRPAELEVGSADARLGGGAGAPLAQRARSVDGGRVTLVRLDQQVLDVLHDQTDGHCNRGGTAT